MAFKLHPVGRCFTEQVVGNIAIRANLDVDDIYDVDEILSSQQRAKYKIVIIPYTCSVEDENAPWLPQIKPFIIGFLRFGYLIGKDQW